MIGKRAHTKPFSRVSLAVETRFFFPLSPHSGRTWLS
jgi:hypothetical protein